MSMNCSEILGGCSDHLTEFISVTQYFIIAITVLSLIIILALLLKYKFKSPSYASQEGENKEVKGQE